MSDDDDVVVANLGMRVRRLLVSWAEHYGGPCQHPGEQQYGRPTDLRSGCWSCASSSPMFDTWRAVGPCDACGAVTGPPERVWSLPAEQTGGVALLVRLCTSCTAEMKEPEREETPVVCNHCADLAADAAEALTASSAPPDLGEMHGPCREAYRAAMRGSDRRLVDAPRQVRLAALRLRWALLEGDR